MYKCIRFYDANSAARFSFLCCYGEKDLSKPLDYWWERPPLKWVSYSAILLTLWFFWGSYYVIFSLLAEQLK